MKRALAMMLVLTALVSWALAEGIPTPQVGDTVVFGRYEQDGDPDNGKEPIEWLVLDVQDGNAWLLSKYCLESVIFYPKRVPMYWAVSDLRVWMNDTFFNDAFSPEEQEAIQLTVVKNDNPHGMKGAGADTLDHVYLLSYNEVMNFFPEQKDRIAYPTAHAKAQNCTVSKDTGSCRWWTRTPGSRKMDICGIRVDGRMTKYGMQDVDWPGNCMRPTLWVRCEDGQ